MYFVHLDGFKIDYLKNAGGENNLHVKAGDAVKSKNGSAKWQLYDSPDSVIDLEKALAEKDNVLAKYDGSDASFCAIAEREGVTFYGGPGEPQRISFYRFMEYAK